MSVIFKKSKPQSVQPETQIDPAINDASSIESPVKKKRVFKPVKPVMPTPAELNGDGILRTKHILALLDIGLPALLHRVQKGYFPEPLRNPRPYWLAATVKAYLERSAFEVVEAVVRASREQSEEEKRERSAGQLARREQMTGDIARRIAGNMKRAKTIKARETERRELREKYGKPPE